MRKFRKLLGFFTGILLADKALALVPGMFASVGSFFIVGLAVFGLLRAAYLIG